MRKADIQPGAEAYYAEGRGADWRYAPPTRAVVVTADPYTIARRRQGPFWFVSWHPDPDGTAVLVDLHERGQVRRAAVPARLLRGLWKPTLAALGRAEADVKAYDALLSDIAAQPGALTGGDLLRLAAADPNVNHDTLTVLADAADPKEK
ncbi:hypothetical protein AB0K35_27840 [Micromonospora sp. NPDC053740]|uniref:hypothetical protein n=1 Tax=Micromonospora sp. NPDC053740 TaxID=3155173 RepID=UPI0034407B05